MTLHLVSEGDAGSFPEALDDVGEADIEDSVFYSLSIS